jgi:hypothetical protein
MNERIQQLAREAGHFEFNKWDYFDIEKFAELIVRECARVASNQVMDVEGNDWGVRYAVEKHFGVQE